MTKIGIGIIGCGNISSQYLRLARLFKGLEVRAIADMNHDTAIARATEFGVEARSISDLLTSPDIGMIVNLTIPDAHFSVTKSILEAGKHAYSEKPLVLTLAEGEELRALAEAKSLRVGCAPDTFLGGTHQQARAELDAGRIGRVTHGTCHVLSAGMEAWHPNPDFFFLPGGGPILDLGPYYVAALINLLGPVKRVGAMSNSAHSERTIGNGPRLGETVPVKTPTTVHALMEFHSGAQITLSASWDTLAHRHKNMELYGTQGAMFLTDPNFFGGTLQACGVEREVQDIPLWDHPFSVPNDKHGDGMMANYRTAGLADMAAAIMEGREHRCSLERTLHGVDVMAAILKSGETGHFIDITTTCTRPEPLGIDAAHALMG